MQLGRFKIKISETWRSVFTARILAIVVCAMAFAVIAGPFGTTMTMTLLERALFWVPVISISVLMGWLSYITALLLFENRHPALIEAAASGIMLIPFVPCVIVIKTLISPEQIAMQGEPARVAFNVLVAVVGVAVIRYAVVSRPSTTGTGPKGHSATDPAGRTSVSQPRLLTRLPQAKRAPVLRISAKDHRVEVVTHAGAEDLRLRLSDAIAEMEPVEGFLTHRSHWVAKAAVKEAHRRDAGKIYLKLTNGDLVPVSRSFRPDWLVDGLAEINADGRSKGAASVRPLAPDQSVQQSPPRA